MARQQEISLWRRCRIHSARQRNRWGDEGCLPWLVFLSAQVVQQVFEPEEERPDQDHCACCFKWDHRAGMIHCIDRRRSPKDYGVVVTVALRNRCQCIVYDIRRNRAIGTKDCEGPRFVAAPTITCFLQVTSCRLTRMPVKRRSATKRRSGCPVSVSLEVFGDRWSLLIVRDLMVRGYRTFKEFLESGEGIASNVLADRLQRLEASGIISAERVESDNRRINYRLTEKGIDLAPVMLDLLIWGARHEQTGASCSLVLRMEKNRDEILNEARRRWEKHDATPLIPKFGSHVARGLGSARRTSKEKL
jgi:DNA-binding HxlR family transcriptional regulator